MAESPLVCHRCKQALPLLDHFYAEFRRCAHCGTRVAEEESQADESVEGGKASFSTYLMSRNTKVAIFCIALGRTRGLGTSFCSSTAV